MYHETTKEKEKTSFKNFEFEFFKIPYHKTIVNMFYGAILTLISLMNRKIQYVNDYYV